MFYFIIPILCAVCHVLAGDEDATGNACQWILLPE